MSKISKFLDEIYSKQQLRSKLLSEGVPQVGIIYVVKNHIYIDSTPVDRSLIFINKGKDFINHENDHFSYWKTILSVDHALRNFDYADFPRGRVIYVIKSKKFLLYLDKCIMSKKLVINKIISLMNLPTSTKISTDEHYQCSKCEEVVNSDNI
jgi:hypothetical protein